MSELPTFPVDDATLDMLMAAIDPRSHGDPDAEKSSVWAFLEFLSQLGGSDTKAIAEVHDDGSDSGQAVYTMRDPHYHDHDVIVALIGEVRRLRGIQPAIIADRAALRDDIRSILNRVEGDVDAITDEIMDVIDDAAAIARGCTRPEHTGTPHDVTAQPEQGRDKR